MSFCYCSRKKEGVTFTNQPFIALKSFWEPPKQKAGDPFNIYKEWDSLSSNSFADWCQRNVALNSLDISSDSILKLEMSSPETLSPSAPTPGLRGPMMDILRRSWISSEIISRFPRAVLYSFLAWDSLACRSSTFFFRFWGRDDEKDVKW